MNDLNQIYKDILNFKDSEVEMLKKWIFMGPKYPNNNYGVLPLNLFTDNEKMIIDDLRYKTDSQDVKQFKFFNEAFKIEFIPILQSHAIIFEPYKVDLMIRCYDNLFRGRFEKKTIDTGEHLYTFQFNVTITNNQFNFEELKSKIISSLSGKIAAVETPSYLYHPENYITVVYRTLEPNIGKLIDLLSQNKVEVTNVFELPNDKLNSPY